MSIFSCYGNVTYTNEDSEKEKGLRIANKFYESKDLISEQDSLTIANLLSNEFLGKVSKNTMFKTLQSQRQKYGTIKGQELYSWSTERRTGSNPYWECKLSFHVKYENEIRDEDLILIKDNDSIKILYYGI
ncbi:MAG: hypothetical protein ACR2MS_09630 [Weeksellaceae bacterium]